jgi:hypothetical protein
MCANPLQPSATMLVYQKDEWMKALSVSTLGLMLSMEKIERLDRRLDGEIETRHKLGDRLSKVETKLKI